MWLRVGILLLVLLWPVQAISHYDDSLGTITIGNDPTVAYTENGIGKNTWLHFDTKVRGIKTVELNSFGGYIIYAEIIARLIRKHKINTVVRSGSECSSACVLIFQAGIRRVAHEGAVFMLHPAVRSVNGVYIDSKQATVRFNAFLVKYGMKRSALRLFRGDGDTYFDANTALGFGIATEVVGK